MANKTIQTQQKELLKKLQDEQATKRFCKICKKEIRPAYRCSCAGGGPGADSSPSADTNEKGASATGSGVTSDTTMSQSGSTKVSASHDGISTTVKPTLTPTVTLRELLANLIKKNLLTFDSNQGLATLTIQCDPKKLTEAERNAVRELTKEILQELEDFKNKNKLSDKDCIVKIEKNENGDISSLKITIPNQKLYNQFISQLKEKGLVPQSLGADNQHKHDKPSHTSPSPLRTKPTPPGYKE